MRRLCVSTAPAAATVAGAVAVVTVPSRNIYTTWGTVAQEPWAKATPWLKRITSQSNYRSFNFWHVKEVDGPEGVKLSPVEQYLLSCIEDDTNRLLHVSWTYDFDPFWNDRVNSHLQMFQILYEDGSPIYKFIFGNCAHHTEAKLLLEKKLNYLRSVLMWANKTERRYSAIVKTRLTMQRSVWNALERERMLAACCDVVETYRAKVPAEFRAKAMGELEVQLTHLRHWVWDCPNAKRTFTRQLA